MMMRTMNSVYFALSLFLSTITLFLTQSSLPPSAEVMAAAAVKVVRPYLPAVRMQSEKEDISSMIKFSSWYDATVACYDEAKHTIIVNPENATLVASYKLQKALFYEWHVWQVFDQLIKAMKIRHPEMPTSLAPSCDEVEVVVHTDKKGKAEKVQIVVNQDAQETYQIVGAWFEVVNGNPRFVGDPLKPSLWERYGYPPLTMKRHVSVDDVIAEILTIRRSR